MKSTMLILLALGAPSTALAQSNPLVSSREGGEAPAPPAAAAPLDGASTVLDAAAAPGARLVRVEIDGDPPGKAPAVRSLRPLLGKALDAATLRAAADRVAATYKAQGYALYTVRIPDQDLSGGVLRLQVLLGYVEEVVLHGDTKGDLSLVRAYGERLGRERPLRRATLERYVSLTRDIPGLEPEIRLLQGSRPGAVKLAVGLKQTRHELAYKLNTRAQPLLGETQLQADWTLNGLFRQGEQTRFTAAASTDFERFRLLGVAHSEPVGADGARLQLRAAHLRTRPNNLAVEGTATSAGVMLSYPLLRGYQTNLVVSGGLDGLKSDSAVFGQTLATEDTRVLRLAGAYSRQKPKYAVALTLGAAQGLDALGARLDPLLADADFRKLNVRTGYDRQFGKSLVARLRFAAQVTGDALPASEQMSLGGAEFGRAYDTALLLADQGSAGSVELGWVRPKGAPQPLSVREVYVFADAGRLTRNARSTVPEASDHLSSAGLGVRLAVGKKSALGVEVARPLDRPAGLGRARTRWAFSLRAAY